MRASVVRTEWRECVFELLERFFLNARYIAPADAAARGKLTLGLRRLVGKPVAERENFPLARREHLLHDFAEFSVHLPRTQVFKKVLLRVDHVHERKRCAVLACFNALGKRNIRGRLLLRPKIHQDFILNTSSSVCGKPCALAGIERGDALDKADGADGNEVLLIGRLRVILLIRMKQKESRSRKTSV